jgi:enamine deaminase RidA (YjgF/YER057c/UK114 family)
MIERKLKDLAIELPDMVKPIASYVPAIQFDELVFVSGQLPIVEGSILHPGKVGEKVNSEQAREAAKVCVINSLAAVKNLIGDLEKIKRVIRIGGYVACEPSFVEHPFIVNGASDFLNEILGESGKHSRLSVGVNSLPLDSCIEIEFIYQIKAEH